MANVPMVFLSSTRLDLEPERRAVRAVLELLELPHNSMESFGAQPEMPRATCLKSVERCDVFLLVVGHKYGTPCEDGGISYTEMEYRHARQHRKKILAYIKSNDVRVLPAHVERGNMSTKLDEFRNELWRMHTAASFREDVELGIRVAIDLGRVSRDWSALAAGRAEQKPESPSGPAMGGQRVSGAEVGTCLLVGAAWPGLESAVKEAQFPHRFFDRSLDNADLAGLKVLIVVGPGFRGTNQFTEQQAASILNFVRSGGGILCVGQAWSWAYEAYGNKPVESYPVNRIGQELGFLISARNVGGPASESADKEIFGTVDSWLRLTDRYPSAIELLSDSTQPILRDSRGNPIAVKSSFGKGSVVAVGCHGLMEDNPWAFQKILRFLMKP